RSGSNPHPALLEREDCTLVAWYRCLHAPRAREGRMTVTIGRRELLAALGGAAVTWPLAARAQKLDRVWQLGYLNATEIPGEPQAQAGRLIMEAALARLGYIEGKNLVIERRLLSNRIEQVNEAAAELAALRP